MYDLTKFSLRDVAKCGLALRQLSKNAVSMADASQKIVQYFYEHFSDLETGEDSCALVRLYKTHVYGELDESLKASASNLLGNTSPPHTMKCWTLLATTETEVLHPAIPLIREEIVVQTPSFSQLIEQFSLDFYTVIERSPENVTSLNQEKLNIFFVQDAVNNPLISEQDSFIITQGIKSILGFGGFLPSGNLFTVVLYLKLPISYSTAELFSTIALSVKTAVLPFDGGVVFGSGEISEKTATDSSIVDLKILQSQIATLNQLLDLSEKSTLKQANRLERMIANLKQEIAERYQTEQALRESQAKFAGILNIAEDAIISVDENHYVQMFNQGAERIFGYSADEVIGQSLDILLPLSARRNHQSHIHSFGQSKTVARTMSERSGAGVFGRRKNGEEFPAEASISKLKLDNSFLFTVSLKDITERKQTEEAIQQKNQELASIVQSLQESQAKFSGILNIADDAIISIDEKQTIQLFNQGAEKIFGYSTDEVIGQSLEILLPFGARSYHQQHINNFGKGGTVARTMSERSGAGVFGRRKNGEEFPAEASISKLKVGDGFLFTVILKDITERKQGEIALRKKHEELAQTLQQLETTQGELIQSEKMAALGQLVAGVAHEINTPLGAIRSSVEYISDFLKQNLETLPEFFQEFSVERKQQFQALLQRSTQNTITVSGRERRQLRKAIAAELEAQQIDKADTLANLLIDLGIHNNFDAFIDTLKDSDSENFLKSVRQFARLQESVRDINTASDRAAKVVFALKTYARQDHSGETIEANIVDGIETVLTLYHNYIKHGVDVKRNYAKIPPIRCYFDELNQVWTNLIHNALQAMDNKGLLTVDIGQQNGHVKVSITDSGKGIPPEIKERIFQPFFTTKPPGEGSGLGLDIVKKIIQKHQGNIQVDSVPGKTTFTVSLPINLENAETKTQEAEAAHA
jgi:PAS domain S-box-containing protein